MQHLSGGEAAALRAVGFDVPDRAGLPAPGVVDEQLGVYAEHAVERLRVRETEARHVAHRIKPAGGEPFGVARAEPPEVRQRLVIPEQLAVAALGQLRNADAVLVRRTLFGPDVHGDLAQIEVRADPRRGGDAGGAEHVLNDAHGKIMRGLMAHAEIHRRVDEDLIDGIDVDILWRDVFQIDLIDLRAHLDIPGHLRHGDEIAQRLAWVGKLRCVRGLALENVVRRQSAALVVDLLHPAHNLKQPCASGNAVRLQRGRHRKTDRLRRAALIGHNQMRCERIEIPVPAGHGGIKGLQVDRNIGFWRWIVHRNTLVQVRS